jgi:protein arginine kinase
MDEIQRLALVESHVISLEHANSPGEREVVRDPDGSLALMLNEEDHLRMQVIASGLALDSAFERATKFDATLQGVIEFAFHPRFGFLTSCPTNVGTGMRISVMLHLPALVFTKKIDKVFNSVAKMNLAVRGFYGEGTKALSDLYQISNQVTLGRAPETLLDDLRRVLPKIISLERDVRVQVLETGRIALEDRVCRALGILRSARSLSSEEAFELLSMVRMGVHLAILDELGIEVVNQLFMLSQPGHLQASQGGQPLEAAERDVVRARLIRDVLNG